MNKIDIFDKYSEEYGEGFFVVISAQKKESIQKQ